MLVGLACKHNLIKGLNSVDAAAEFRVAASKEGVYRLGKHLIVGQTLLLHAGHLLSTTIGYNVNCRFSDSTALPATNFSPRENLHPIRV